MKFSKSCISYEPILYPTREVHCYNFVAPYLIVNHLSGTISKETIVEVGKICYIGDKS